MQWPVIIFELFTNDCQNAPQFNLPSGNLKKAFGMDRIKVLEYIDALLGFQSKPVDKIILDHDLVSVIMVRELNIASCWC